MLYRLWSTDLLMLQNIVIFKINIKKTESLYQLAKFENAAYQPNPIAINGELLKRC